MARVKGIVLDEDNNPVEGVNVSFQQKNSKTNENGFYQLAIPSKVKSNLKFTHLSLKTAVISLELNPNEDYEFNVVLKSTMEQLGEIVISNSNKKRVEGITTLSPKAIRLIPGANSGVENILKSLPGVNSNNELSTQYAVRGGNYDENLVYVNEIEVYRPFLIRSGQQEGLSFTNTDLIQHVDFSSGGFQAKYGDKLSSVLDITYRKPTKFGASLEASFLGGSVSMDNVSKDQKWNAVTGIRYRDNSLLVKSQETQTNFKPRFADLQTYITFTPNLKWQLGFLGNVSQNKYDYRPFSRQTNFGSLQEPLALLVQYEGVEKDAYTTTFGAIKAHYKINDNSNLKWINSIYHTIEQEYYDIMAEYKLGEINSNLGDSSFGNVEYARGIGSQFTHARNDLDALIVNTELKGNHKIKENQIDWGFKYTHESIRDRIREWEVIDSAGFLLNPPKIFPKKVQPYTPYIGPLVPYTSIRAVNYTNINRFSAYFQWNKRLKWREYELFINAGVRTQSWKVIDILKKGNSQITFSPRVQFAIKPNWRTDMLFRISGGWYHQPPFYRELRDSLGEVKPNIKAQESTHIVLGHDFSFKMWKRPFKLVTELYYKDMNNVNPYTIDNVRIRYKAINNAEAYAKGIDVRMNGEFIPGTESWLSFGYMDTQESIEGKGYIPRPTDQRLKFGALFQDYVPNIPALKMYLNLVYNTGLPGGSPSYANPYEYQSRLRDYRRADIGFSYVFTDRARAKEKDNWLRHFKELALGMEIFNMFDNQNSITNTWVRDVYTKNQYGVPNYLTTRVFSIKLNVKI
ncbi:carboxypeptidase-like regulatory domain-containing protein [Flavobacterium columnare]|uniref:carboxypeptidase-like regulatory domain-containing protein n=1 Tax=Flavobacterium columnare TaxID=996 RepID=UPI0017824C4E|nr:carboxypeptidase-like regulatory domain-containing protein [Flavobacterium columnare]QOG91086.1 carboxypeptidase-like regulatory domain-containing protein [Flavobacterium columnare]QOG93740.1 carboxypeptidase-like regulatory domain-containing protein [Flavobacterium columnare]QOG96407.1 carboxypeptidase-like regulatory domain-containing protein [Flavobacterium columnare]QOG99066.1 carboxypeptidase-like regulatory domain-containing protein [Flavobacterium columnare]QOH01725.1 carboxypeptidas